MLLLLAPFERALALDAGRPGLTDPAPLYSGSVDLDRTGRVLAEVEINGRGPYRFILDTGANRSALSPMVGYARAAGIAREALKRDKTVRAVAVEKGILSRAEAERLLDLKRLTEPSGQPTTPGKKEKR